MIFLVVVPVFVGGGFVDGDADVGLPEGFAGEELRFRPGFDVVVLGESRLQAAE